MTTAAVQVPEGVDAGIAWHFGDPLREQRVLARRAGVVVRDNRDVLTVTGPERLPWLHSITSQHLSALLDGDSTQVLVLSPHGHVEQHWQFTELGGTAWIDTEPGAAVDVLTYLQKMIFMKRVEPADVSSEWGVLTLAGPMAAGVLVGAGLPVPDQNSAIALSAGFVRHREDSGGTPGSEGVAAGETFDLLVPRAEVPRTTQALTAAGAEPVGQWAYEARRVERREPRLNFETDHKTIPHEVGWIGSAVHLDKGCYRGQETVARVQNLGKPPRSLVLLHLAGEGDELPQPGTAVELNGRTVGFVGTAVQHYELGPIALAVIKRSLAEDATSSARLTATSSARLTVAGSPVTLA
ncbi:MAG TPA: folate-binding protein [Jatrophihabitans sp.]